MTTSLVDPRPSEPDWVSALDLPDRIRWTIVRRPWNRETKQYDTVTVTDDGDSHAFLNGLTAILNSRDLECQITVDATNFDCCNDLSLIYFGIDNLPSGYDLGLFWSIRPVLGEEETGTCTDELFSWVQYLLEEQKAFEIELSYLDPTP